MNQPLRFTLKVLRKLLKDRSYTWRTDEFCDFIGQEGNDYIASLLHENAGCKGLMLAKFGTIELSNIIAYIIDSRGLAFNDYIKHIQGKIDIDIEGTGRLLHKNSGVFPEERSIVENFVKLALEDCRQIDVLASYIDKEKYLKEELGNCKRVDLDAFYAPFLWEKPWTKELEGKRVLVVHPFVESIASQYHNHRKLLFENPDVLPEFKELICIKAVQSVAGEKVPFKDWFEALEFMKAEIDKCGYDVALIGCGAYGMSLAAHVKRSGKIGIHLAGWLQMLFGVYGNRWIKDQPEYAGFINEHWIRPNVNERIKNGSKIENGCYW